MRHRAFPMLGMLVALLAPAAADDADDIRSVIEAQIEGFRRDDGEARCSFSVPAIKEMFPTVDAFMGMVRRGYQPVYRPKSFVFGPLKQDGRAFIQQLRIVGPDDRDWAAVYTPERQPDGDLRVTGCYVARTEGSSA